MRPRIRLDPGVRGPENLLAVDGHAGEGVRIDTRESIGALLAGTRGEQGISQLRLAERLCASSGTPTVTRHEISRWEREERIPSGYWLGWLAVALDVPLTRLERAAAVARRRRRLGWVAARRQTPPRKPWRHGPVIPPTWYEETAGVYTRIAS